MKISGIKRYLPSWQSAGLGVLSALLLILAFPGFELAWVAWISFIPLLLAIDREKESAARALITGWVFGTCFFFGTCWWLTYSPINYAGFPAPLAYFLLLCVCLVTGIFPGLFALILSVLLRRLGTYAVFSTPFIWIATEFLRFWVTGNNWNAIAYSQAFDGGYLKYASIGSIYLVGFLLLIPPTVIAFAFLYLKGRSHTLQGIPPYILVFIIFFGPFAFLSKTFRDDVKAIDAKGGVTQKAALFYITALLLYLIVPAIFSSLAAEHFYPAKPFRISGTAIVAIQPNVPMSGLVPEQYEELKRKHITLAEKALDSQRQQQITDYVSGYFQAQTDRGELDKAVENALKNQQKIVIFPESPMNFMYEEDKDFQEFVRAFAVKNNASVLFNAAEPDPGNKKYFNSAVMVDASGNKVAQYDKIYLVPFGETVPAPLQNIVPALVGSFSYGKEYDLLPFGDAKGGIMICFESHFPNLSREYVKEGADVLIEMTNDGYLGPTPVLRQHLANAVFRAVETGRPLLRVTNVGISAYINENGDVLEPTTGYTEDARVWSVAKSDGGRTLYVRFGDWFAWLCSVVTVGLLVFGLMRRRKEPAGSSMSGS